MYAYLLPFQMHHVSMSVVISGGDLVLIPVDRRDSEDAGQLQHSTNTENRLRNVIQEQSFSPVMHGHMYYSYYTFSIRHPFCLRRKGRI